MMAERIVTKLHVDANFLVAIWSYTLILLKQEPYVCMLEFFWHLIKTHETID